MNANVTTSTDHRDHYSWRGLAVVTIVALVIVNVAIGLANISIASRDLVDTDGPMRYSRILDLVQGRNGWWDGTVAWSNTPFGHSMHWTRPLDALVTALGAPLAPFVGWRDAIYFGALLSAPMLHLALAAATAWAAKSVLTTQGAVLAALAVAFQPTVLSYASVGRLDHHILILALCMVTFGAVLRLLTDTAEPARAASIAGLAAAATLWVSIEALLVIGLAFGALVIVWILRGSTRSVSLTPVALWFAIGTVAATFIESGFQGFSSVEYDRISAPHVSIAVGLLVVAVLATTLTREHTALDRPVLRFAVAAALASVLGVALRLMFPLILGGPFAAVPDRVNEIWLDFVSESQPMWSGDQPATSIALSLGLAFAGLLVLAVRLRPGSTVAHRTAWSATAGWLLVVTVLALTSLRFGLYAEALAALPVAWWISDRLAHVVGGTLPSMRRVGWVMLAAGGYIIPALLVVTIEGPGAADASSSCPLVGVSAELAALRPRLDDPNGRPLAVLSDLDDGAELHMRAGVDVVATPHHRNTDGIVDAWDTMRAPLDEARVRLESRSIDVVLVCPERDRDAYSPQPEGSLIAALVAGDPPSWLVRLPDEDQDFDIYEVLDEG